MGPKRDNAPDAKTQIFDTVSLHKQVCDACAKTIPAGRRIRITIFVGSNLRNRVTHLPSCSPTQQRSPTGPA